MASTLPVAIVTGASSGMGKSIALRLLKEGFVVYGLARRIDLMQPVVVAGGMALAVDVTDGAAVSAAVARVLDERGRIDLLVNNAGYGQYGALEDVPLDAARGQMEVNLLAPARLVQLCLPHMRARRSGKIVNVSSIGGKFATPLGGWYHASKFALEGYSDALRNEVKPFGIDVIVIEPGGIATEWGSIAADQASEHSGSGPYASLVAAFRKLQSHKAPQPDIISDLVMRAISSGRPAARYAAGSMAKPLLFLRRHLSDAMFDKLIMFALR